MSNKKSAHEFDYDSFMGFPDPHWTQVPDILFDLMLPDLSGAELKVLLYLLRRTYGFKKDGDNITLSQLCNGIQRADGTVVDRGTGLSRSSVARAVKSLEERNLIEVVRDLTAIGDAEINYYRIRRLQNEGGGGFKIEPPPSDFETGVVSKSNHGSSKTKPPVVSKSNHPYNQETVVQETEQQQSTRTPPKNALAQFETPHDGDVVVVDAITPTEKELSEKLTTLGVAGTTIRKLLKDYDTQIIYRWACYTEYKLQSGWVPKESPAAWLVSAIRSEDWVIPDWFKTPQEEATEKEETKKVAARERKRLENAQQQEQLEAKERRQAIEQSLGVGERDRLAWEQTVELLEDRGHITTALYSTFLLQVKSARAILATPVRFFVDVIEQKSEEICEALEDVTGEEVAHIEVRHVRLSSNSEKPN